MKKSHLIPLFTCLLIMSCTEEIGSVKKSEAKVKSDSIYLSVSSALVFNTSVYGYVSEGSVLYDVSQSEQGYMVELKRGGNTISVSFCNKEGLKNLIKTIEYKTSLKDSIIPLNIPLK